VLRNRTYDTQLIAGDSLGRRAVIANEQAAIQYVALHAAKLGRAVDLNDEDAIVMNCFRGHVDLQDVTAADAVA
jgi:hypothetical protein